MAVNYPTSLDTFTNPTSSSSVANPSHSQQHADANDAIEALQSKVGTENSAVTTSHDYRIRQLELNPVTGTAKKIEQIVVNNTGSTLLKGQAVYASGSVGASGKLRVALSSNTAESTSTKTFGILAENIVNGGEGLLISEGLLEDLDTTGSNDGDPVWLGSTAGSKLYGLENKPSAPSHLVFLGIVVRGGNANNGSIFVKIQNGFELEELHNVSISSVVDNQVLRYDSTTGLWKNESIDSLFDPAGSAAAALQDANDYTDIAVANLGNSLPTTYIPLSYYGNPDGVATLDENSFVPQAQLDIDARIQDTAAAIITDATHTNITATYDPVTKELSLASTGGTSADISSTPPASPNTGDFWLDADNAVLYIYDGQFWTEVSSGPIGPQGPAGAAGATGPAGADGDDGAQGEIGFPGFLYDPRRAFANQYTAGEIIYYNGSYYICLANNDAIPPTGGAIGVYWNPYSFGGGGGSGNFTLSTTPPEDPTEGDTWFDTANAKLYVYYDSFWVEVVSPGPTGAQGPAFVNYQGNYNSAVSYTLHDGVTYQGSLWRLNENNSPAGTVPSTPDWQKVIHKGDKGDTGEITIGTVTTVLHGEPATVTNSGTTIDAVLDFEIPAGRASTITVGDVDNVDFGQPLTIVNSGDVSDAVFDFEIPAGRAATIQVGDVDDVLYGNPPTVVNSGTTSDAIFDFEIPAGRAATINVGTVTTVLDGNPATVTNSGDTSDAIFDFQIPAGPRSTIEIGSVDDVDFGTPSTVTNSGTTTDAIFDFELQTGRAATVTIGTVTTGNYLTEVEVENVGTVSDAILNFSIPQGIPGEMHDFNVRETPPPNPVEGLVWYNTTNGRAYVYYDSAWVEYSPGFAGPRGPMFLNYQGAWDNTEEYVELDGVTYNGSLWVLEYQTSIIGTPPSSPAWSLVVEKGATGEISVGQVTDVLYGEPPTVTNSGTSIDAVFDFEIPAGRASTIVVGTVEDVNYGNPPTIVNSGTTSDAIFDFEIPAGRAATIQVGTVDDVNYGNPPTVTNSGTTSDATFDFEIPAGRAATLAVGTVTTVLDGEPATVINSGTTSDAVFDFEIPAGPRSTIQIGDVIDVDFGNPSTVTNVGTTSDAIFDFELQTGRASTLAVGTVETGTYYSQATVENVGTVSDAIFNFSIPQGIPGDFQPGLTPPSNPLAGQVWYNTETGRAYIYYDSTWIEFSPGFAGPAGPAGSIISESVSSSINVQKDHAYFVDTSAIRTLTLPASPSLGDSLRIYDASGSASTNNITIARNGKKINGQTQDSTINVNQAVVRAVYTGETLGWRLTNEGCC